jgi:hypothetical protein
LPTARVVGSGAGMAARSARQALTCETVNVIGGSPFVIVPSVIWWELLAVTPPG